MDIRSDRQKGMSYVELGKKYHIDPRTARRYAESPQKPEYTLSEPKPTKIDPHKQIVDEWLEEAPYSAIRILECDTRSRNKLRKKLPYPFGVILPQPASLVTAGWEACGTTWES